MTRRFVAPGKVVVLGEYAVLDGAPALVAAVDMGVSVDVSPSKRRVVTTPTGDSSFVDACLDDLGIASGAWAFGTYNAPPTKTKPGLGGSAAAATVATFAGRAWLGLPTDPATVCEQATRLHHRVQGSGSGVDVAASSFGGMLRFVRGQTPTPVDAPPVVVVWSGNSAKTGPRVHQYNAWSDRTDFVRRSAELTDAYASDPIGTLRSAADLLESMAEQTGIAYRTPALDHIRKAAEAVGGAAKPSGAGGGDCAVAVLPDADALNAFRDALTGADMCILATQLAPGVREVPPGAQ